MKAIELIFGENTYLIEKETKTIKKSFGEIIQGINYVVIDPNVIENIIAELETPAFGYPKKLIIVKNCDLLKKELKTKKSKNSDIIEKLSKYIEENIQNIENNINLLVIENTIDKTNKLYKTIEKYGIVKEFNELKPNELIQNLGYICNVYNVKINNDTLKYLIEKCGTSLQELINEIRKLIEYAGNGGTIDKHTVDLLCIPKIEAVIFDLTDNLGNKKASEALNVLKNLIYNKEPIQKILITLYNHFKKLYLVKLAIRENEDVSLALNLKTNQTFLIGKYKRQAEYFSEEQLRKILDELINLDYGNKMRKN